MSFLSFKKRKKSLNYIKKDLIIKVIKMWAKYQKKLEKEKELYLRIKVIPGSNCNEMRGEMDDKTVKVAIKAVAEKGKANIALIKYLSKELALEKKNVKIISGAGSRIKLIKLVK